ncbi:DUF6602 domain-containing protein [Microvirga sp. 2MCAF38]|uniref:DUF6602 domain-containing protein n=1 Tax=Microvirga sp. 2MCAF38 TaxID=3232989 RepID=UPI003F9D9CA5
MLKSHMDACENTLVATSKIPANSGHSLHKGTPREAFIREFLQSHLPEKVAIGTGEIIDANSQPGEPRNQFDIVIYKKNYPRLDFGGGVSGFLIESVIATVEVKSTLTRADLEQAIKAALNAKTLTPSITSKLSAGYIPPKVLNFVVAYDGPAQVQTIHNWIQQIHVGVGITIPNLPQAESARLQTGAPSIDGVFVLNKGFVYFDNAKAGFGTPQMRAEFPNLKWIMSDTSTGNLLFLFLLLQEATANIEGQWLNASPYLASFNLSVQIGF